MAHLQGPVNVLACLDVSQCKAREGMSRRANGAPAGPGKRVGAHAAAAAAAQRSTPPRTLLAAARCLSRGPTKGAWADVSRA